MIPYKHNLLALALMLVLSQTAFSQVKKQYKDEVFAQTTIVVKESKTDATDQEILDAQFDIDDFGMDQVIKITTESNRVKAAAAAPAPEFTEKGSEPIKQVAEVPVEAPSESIAQVEEPIVAKATVIKSTEAPIQVQKEKAAPSVQQGTTRTSRVRLGSSNHSYSKSSKRSYKKKRFKKKKRKRARKGKRYKCYKF